MKKIFRLAHKGKPNSRLCIKDIPKTKQFRKAEKREGKKDRYNKYVNNKKVKSAMQ